MTVDPTPPPGQSGNTSTGDDRVHLGEPQPDPPSSPDGARQPSNTSDWRGGSGSVADRARLDLRDIELRDARLHTGYGALTPQPERDPRAVEAAQASFRRLHLVSDHEALGHGRSPSSRYPDPLREANPHGWDLTRQRPRPSGAGQVHALLQSLVKVASSVVDAPATACLFEDGVLVRIASSLSQAPLGSAVPIDGTICGQAVLTRAVVRTGFRAGAGGHTASAACCDGAASHLAVPLLHNEELLGLLVLTADQEEWFDDRAQGEVAVLAGVASRALAGMPTSLAQTPPSGVTASPAPLHALGMWSWDAAGGTTRCSPSVVAMLGLPSEDEISLTGVRQLIHPSELARFEALIGELIKGGGGVSSTFRVMTPHGERHVHAWCETRWSRSGHVLGAWGAAVDVTVREKEAAALRSSVAGLRAAKKLTGLGVWEWHPADGRLEWSDEMYRFLGLEPGEVRPTLEMWHRAVHPEDRHRAMHLDALAGADGGGTVAMFRVMGFDDVERHVQSWSTVMPADGSAPSVIAGAVVDVTRQIKDRAELDRRSATDPVTGLANRLGFERWMSRLQDSSEDVGLLLLDLDRFKMVNDSLGHPVGDRLLVEVARRLEKVTPAGSLTARMGGDEFVVVPPPGAEYRELQDVAQNVVDALRAPIVVGGTGEVLFCPVSVGVTSSAGRRVDTDVLLAEADLALYRAKDQGRDRYAVFDDALREKVRRRHRTEQALRSAMEDNRLVLQYQPIVDFRTDRLVGAEALVRMRTEDGQLLMPPDGFIDVAEDIGLVIDVDCWVVDAALDQLARWWRNASPSHVPWLAVNVSPRSMEHPRLVRQILDGVQSRGLPPHLLKVELTESSFLSSLRGGAKALQSLIAHQIPVGIDDFGTGYSALTYLSTFNLDFMKIDRSFVARLGHDARADAVVEAIVALAHAHLMKVTAEGVETARQARRLREMHCDYAQGFHFGRPGDAAALIRN